jgi:hypothetical protein
VIQELALAASILVAKPYRLIADYDKVPVHSKVCAIGHVVYRRRMVDDNDWHVTIIDSKGKKLVLEIIPEIVLEAPKKGDKILACGIGRYDVKHKWPEIHPLLKWQAVK